MNISIGVGVDPEQLQQMADGTNTQEPAAEPAADPPARPTQAAHGRKRARVTGGRFAADDPATAADEAWAES